MATVTRTRPRVKPARSCRLWDVDGARVLTIVIGTGAKAQGTHYHFAEVLCDFGRGFELRKFVTDGGEVYHVHLDPTTGSTCDCLGYLKWSRCKHRDAVAELVRRGRL